MIRPLDTFILARTKLRTRKIRTGFTVGISGLLFGLLVAALLISTGLLGSLDHLGEEGVGKRYIVAASSSPQDSAGIDYSNPEIVARVEQLHTERVVGKTAEAHRLGIDYSAKEEDPDPVKFDKELGKRVIDPSSDTNPSVAQAFKEYTDAHTTTLNIEDYTKGMAMKPQLIESYAEYNTVQPMPNGKESTIVNYGKKIKDEDFRNWDPYSMFNTISIEDDSLTKPYTTVPFDTKKHPDTIPILVPYAYAEKALGLKPLPGSASSSQRMDRIRLVRSKISTLTIDMCYRNATSTSQLGQALDTRKEIENNKNNKTYQKPSVIYAVPDETSCGPVTISSDTRTAAEKTLADKQQQFKKQFGEYIDPIAVKLHLQVIGVTPSPSGIHNIQSLTDGVSMLFSANSVPYWQIPASMFINLPDTLKPVDVFGQQASHAKTLSQLPPPSKDAAIIEFAHLDDAHKFLKRYESGDKLGVQPYANNTLIMKDIRDTLQKIIIWACLAISAIATIVLTSMVGRTIADGRRETAVFRAIGAKRIDITAIYTCYTFLLALRIIIFVAVLGTLIALGVDYMMSPLVTPDALISFGAQNLDQRVSLFSFNSPYFVYIPLLIIGVSLLALIIPLLMSIRRNPINDMRQE